MDYSNSQASKFASILVHSCKIYCGHTGRDNSAIKEPEQYKPNIHKHKKANNRGGRPARPTG